MSTAIKICGLTRAADASLAAELGAWALGFIFFSESRRAVSAAVVRDLIAGVRAGGHAPLMVGVFVNPSLAELEEAVAVSKIDLVQLHGDESPAFCRQLAARLPAVKVIKAVREDLTSVAAFGALEGVLLESAVPGAWGGTGVVGDWSLAQSARQQLKATRLILAGGLNADNVAEALRVVQPDAVDVCSGVEQSAGVKSHPKLRAFFETVAQGSR